MDKLTETVSFALTNFLADVRYAFLVDDAMRENGSSDSTGAITFSWGSWSTSHTIEIQSLPTCCNSTSWGAMVLPAAILAIVVVALAATAIVLRRRARRQEKEAPPKEPSPPT